MSQAQLRSQAPAWEKQGSKRRHEAHKHMRTSGNAKGEPFQSSSCHPRIGPTSQRNNRLLKLGRTTYPASSDFLWHCVTLPASVTQKLCGGTALPWGTSIAKDYQHTPSSPGASSQAQPAGISLKLWAVQEYNYPNSTLPPRRAYLPSNRH